MHIGGKGEGDRDGALYCSSGDPKGTGGERKATLIFCRNIYIPLGFSPTTARRFPKGERKALWCARRRISLPPVGLDAPTPARG